MDISSIISTLAFWIFVFHLGLPLIFFSSVGVSVLRMPMPDQECIVCPLRWVAAIPVDAVTAAGILFSLSQPINWFKRYVFPLPACPVRNTFFPIISRSIACFCVIFFPAFYLTNTTHL